MTARRVAIAVAVGCMLASLPAAVCAQPPVPRTRASVSPGTAHLGERVTYRGIVVVPKGGAPRWLTPEKLEPITWGTPRPFLRPGTGAQASWDTLAVEIPMQAFQLGTLTIPGLRFQDARWPGVHRLPGVVFTVQPTLTPADSNAELRPARGPLRAPWWERVPWRWVALGVLVLAGLVLLVRWWLARRRRRPAAVPQPVLDPAGRALAELAALRALELPQQERFAEHAFELTQLLRRFLEEVTHVPRPGHTTPELVDVLRRTRIDAADLQRLEGLLRLWDRVKFARASSSVDESLRAEDAVERLIRQIAAVPLAPPSEERAA